MLSRSKSSFRRDSSVIWAGLRSNSSQSSRWSCAKIWSRDKMLTAATIAVSDETREVRDRRKMLTRGLRVRVHLHVVLLANGYAKLERVDGIEPQAFAEQRRLTIDLLHADVFEIQNVNEQFFQLLLQLSHSTGSPSPALVAAPP